MTEAALICDTEERRHEIRRNDNYNGLDYLEVVDPVTLKIYFLKKAPTGLEAANVRISGGRRPAHRDIRVVDIEVCRRSQPDIDDCLRITLDKTGDFSTYTLCLLAVDEHGRATDDPFPGFDPRYACLDFSFKVDCPSELDCQDDVICPPETFPESEINYLARDYNSFRRLILDRLALTIPEWQERHVPDVGIALVEVMAYAGDYLSYFQDAVATEAYLDTARQRISVRRHARLVDYQMHEGCNARTWLHLDTNDDETFAADQLSFITRLSRPLPVSGRLWLWSDLAEIPTRHYEVFEPLLPASQSEIAVYKAHNEIHFYTWGDADCCLPKGGTEATLVDGTAVIQVIETDDDAGETLEVVEYQRELVLQPGDVLIFEEVLGPKTGLGVDTDLSHRHAVKLTKVEAVIDDLYQQPLLEVSWHEMDALPFSLCLSAVGPAPYCERIDNISVARGNVILVDHGRRLPCEPLGTVPIQETDAACEVCQGQAFPAEVSRTPGPFRPALAHPAVTFSQRLQTAAPASFQLGQDPRQAVPWIKMLSAVGRQCTTTLETEPVEEAPITIWQPQRDLLASDFDDPHFVAEVDNDGRTQLRFGDGELGLQPGADESFTAVYRVGRGSAGNVGAEAITHVVADQVISGVTLRPRNPLPAQGGTDPEPMSEVKLFAPHAFRRDRQRAIIPEDYAEIVMRDFAGKVQRAAAVLRWAGCWYEVLVAIDAQGQTTVTDALLAEIQAHLYRFRRIGHDVVVRPAHYVPLDIELTVCVLPNYLRGHVKAALAGQLSQRRLADGGLGFFHPDNLTFGEGVYLSKLVATAQQVTGVESIHVDRFERLEEGDQGEREAGLIRLAPLEIARLDQDPSWPENGRLKLNMEGGR